MRDKLYIFRGREFSLSEIKIIKKVSRDIGEWQKRALKKDSGII